MVGIVVVNYNRWQDTISCLTSINRLTYQNFVVAIVDNGSSSEEQDHLIEQINSNFPHGKYIPIILKNNFGYAKGCNEGMKFLLQNFPCKYIWILNNDTIPQPDSLTAFRNCAERSNKKIGIWGGKLLYPDRKTIQAIGGKYIPEKAKGLHIGSGEEDHGQYDNPELAKEMDYIVGASMFVSCEFVKDVGYMNEEYFLFYEEMDWVLRGKEKGWDIGYCPNAIILHKEGATIKKSTLSKYEIERIYFYSIRNKLIFTKKFYPQHYHRIKLRLFSQMLKELKKGNLSRTRILFQTLFFLNSAYETYCISNN